MIATGIGVSPVFTALSNASGEAPILVFFSSDEYFEGVSDSSVNIQVLNATDAVAYEFVVSSTGGGTPVTSSGTVSSANFSVNVNLTALNAGTLTVSYREATVEQATDTATLTTPLVPSAPLNLVVVAGTGQNSLTWDEPLNSVGSPISDYVIEVDDGSGFSVIADGTSTTRSYTHQNLIIGKEYTYRVSATNATGTGAASSTSAGTPTGTVHIFLLAGQSNMLGRPVYDGLGDYQTGKVYDWTGSDFQQATSPLTGAGAGDMGLSITFTDDYLAANPGVDAVALVQTAVGGTSITAWTGPGDTRYDNAVTEFNQAMAAYPSYSVQGILWNQGESDSNSTPSISFRDDTVTMIGNFRSDLTGATSTTPFVLGEIFESDADDITINNWLREVPTIVAYADTALNDSLTTFDGLHWDAASLRTYGERYEDSYLVAAANAPAVPAAISDLAATMTATTATLTWSEPASNRDPITDYIVQYKETSSGTWITLNDGTTPTTGAVVTALTADTSYDFRVAAINGQGVGTYSATLTDTTSDDTAVPGTRDHALLAVNANNGSMWDFTDINTLSQTQDGLTAVTTTGQDIAYAQDLATRNDHMEQGTSTRRFEWNGTSAVAPDALEAGITGDGDYSTFTNATLFLLVKLSNTEDITTNSDRRILVSSTGAHFILALDGTGGTSGGSDTTVGTIYTNGFVTADGRGALNDNIATNAWTLIEVQGFDMTTGDGSTTWPQFGIGQYTGNDWGLNEGDQIGACVLVPNPTTQQQDDIRGWMENLRTSLNPDYTTAKASAHAAIANYESIALYDPGDITSVFEERLAVDEPGTTPSVGDPVGTMLDVSFGGANTTGLTASAFIAAQPELAPDPSAGSWTFGTGWSDAGSGRLAIDGSNVSNSDVDNNTPPLVTGRLYKMELIIHSTNGGNILATWTGTSGAQIPNQNTTGTYVAYFYEGGASGTPVLRMRADAGTIAEISISVKELPGAHMIAPSDAARPTLQQNDTNYYLLPDGTDDVMDTAEILLGEKWAHIGGWGKVLNGRFAFGTSQSLTSGWRITNEVWQQYNDGVSTQTYGTHVASVLKDNWTTAHTRINGINSGSQAIPDTSAEVVDGLRLFSRETDNTANLWNAPFYGAAFIADEHPTETDLHAIEFFMASRSGAGVDITSAATKAMAALANSTVSAVYDYGDTTGMFVETDGQAGIAVSDGSSVGIVLDRSFKGQNTTGQTCAEFIAAQTDLATNGDFATGDTTGWSLNVLNGGDGSVIGNAWVGGRNGGLQTQIGQEITTVSGRWYIVEATVNADRPERVNFKVHSTWGTFGSSLGSITGDANQQNVTQTLKIVFRATSTESFPNFGFTGNVDATIDDLTVREIDGYHAIAPSDAARPVYHSALGGYLESDGVDDSLQLTVPMTTDMNYLDLFSSTSDQYMLLASQATAGFVGGADEGGGSGFSSIGGGPTYELNGVSFQNNSTRDEFYTAVSSGAWQKFYTDSFSGSTINDIDFFKGGYAAGWAYEGRRSLSILYNGTGMAAQDEADIEAWVDFKDPKNAFTTEQRAYAAVANYTTPAFYDPSDLTSLYTARLEDDAQVDTNAVAAGSVGTILDRSFGGANSTGLTAAEFIAVQPDLLNGDGAFDDAGSWTVGSSWTISGGVATADPLSNTNLTQSSILTTGELYQISITVSGLTQGQIGVRFGDNSNQVNLTANGTYSFIGIAAATSVVLRCTACDASIDNLVVKHLPGMHLIAPSDSARATLTEASGLYYLDLDGTDDYYVPETMPNFGTQQWFVVGVEADTSSGAVSRIGNYNDGSNVLYFRAVNNPQRVSFSNTSNGSTEVQPNVFVVERNAGTATFRGGGVAGTDETGVNATAAMNEYNLGSGSDTTWSNGLDGKIYFKGVAPGALDPLDRHAVEEYGAKLTGVTLA